jgi:hypothetical protein
MIHNERLNVDGSVNRALAPMVGTYICGGTGVEEYSENKFKMQPEKQKGAP